MSFDYYELLVDICVKRKRKISRKKKKKKKTLTSKAPRPGHRRHMTVFVSIFACVATPVADFGFIYKKNNFRLSLTLLACYSY